MRTCCSFVMGKNAGLLLCRISVSLARAATSIMFVVTKHGFCHDKSMLVMTNDKHVVMTSLFLLQQTHVCGDDTHLLSQQKYACHDKTFVATNTCLSHQKFCRGKHTFENTCLSQQKWYLWQVPPMIRWFMIAVWWSHLCPLYKL